MRAAQARSDDDSLHGGRHETRDAAKIRRHGGQEVRLPLKTIDVYSQLRRVNLEISRAVATYLAEYERKPMSPVLTLEFIYFTVYFLIPNYEIQ